MHRRNRTSPVPDNDLEGRTDKVPARAEILGGHDFRIREVRTDQYTTSQGMHQYLGFRPHHGFNLWLRQSVEAAPWLFSLCVYGTLLRNFSVQVGDIHEVKHYRGSTLVMLRAKEDTLVSCWNEKTKTRLLQLCRNIGVVEGIAGS